MLAADRIMSGLLSPGARGVEQVCLPLGSWGGGIGEHQSGTKTERDAGGLQRVTARRHVVHEVGLPER